MRYQQNLEPHSSNTVSQWNIVLGIDGIVVGAAWLCAVQVANYRTSRDNPIYLVRICDQELRVYTDTLAPLSNKKPIIHWLR